MESLCRLATAPPPRHLPSCLLTSPLFGTELHPAVLCPAKPHPTRVVVPRASQCSTGLATRVQSSTLVNAAHSLRGAAKRPRLQAFPQSKHFFDNPGFGKSRGGQPTSADMDLENSPRSWAAQSLESLPGFGPAMREIGMLSRRVEGMRGCETEGFVLTECLLVWLMDPSPTGELKRANAHLHNILIRCTESASTATISPSRG